MCDYVCVHVYAWACVHMCVCEWVCVCVCMTAGACVYSPFGPFTALAPPAVPRALIGLGPPQLCACFALLRASAPRTLNCESANGSALLIFAYHSAFMYLGGLFKRPPLTHWCFLLCAAAARDQAKPCVLAADC